MTPKWISATNTVNPDLPNFPRDVYLLAADIVRVFVYYVPLSYTDEGLLMNSTEDHKSYVKVAVRGLHGYLNDYVFAGPFSHEKAREAAEELVSRLGASLRVGTE